MVTVITEGVLHKLKLFLCNVSKGTNNMPYPLRMGSYSYAILKGLFIGGLLY